MTIRVGICDDQPLLRDGLRVQLGLAGDIDVVGEAANGEQAVALARRERPDVLVMDVRMPVLDGIEATRRIVGGAGTEDVKALMLTTFELDEHVYAALSAGASGFLLKDAMPEELVTRCASSRLASHCSHRRSPRQRADAPHRRHQCGCLGPQSLRERGLGGRVAQAGEQATTGALHGRPMSMTVPVHNVLAELARFIRAASRERRFARDLRASTHGWSPGSNHAVIRPRLGHAEYFL
jgi:DNA-binding NarL/FixJ family response regulator